ncbi:energy transducer TonB [Sinimarinibacterium sp. CAU 1509]|uniref:TonB family protein n=1 Tax=Sinimarinibacterium sp. CAU 1509 TaxID=2562283 RepID=UPI0010ACE339|nr:TonB family protein [Sinimarinibacterium sp. CAU 1509]TJY56754.1 energy transducer TonB [Sinimarinibacterium sp. CAU 1509]
MSAAIVRGTVGARPQRRWWAALLLASLLHALLLLRLPVMDSRSVGEGPSPIGQGSDPQLQQRVLDLRLSKPLAVSGAGAASPAAAPISTQPVAGVDADGATADSSAARAHYYAQLRAHLQRFRRVPEGGAQLRGRALVSFSVAADGSVSVLRLVHSAGDALLDDEALALICRAAPVPTPPLGGELRLSVPIVFE